MSVMERILFALVVVATLGIIVSGDPIAMYDVSSHLATTVVLDGLARGDEFLAEHYRVEWLPIPYWLTTALHWPLSKLFGPWLAFRLLLATFAIALPAGWLFLARRTGATPMLAAVVALAVFSIYYWSGITNFLFGQALILPGYRLFLDLESIRSRRFAAFALVAIAAYFAHVFVLASVLGACGLAWVLASLAAPRWPALADFRPRAAHVAGLSFGAALFAAAIWFIFGQPGSGPDRQLLWDLSLHRLGNLFEDPLGSPTIDTPLPAAGLALVLLLAWSVPRIGALRADPRAELARALHVPTLVIATAFAALYFFGPAKVLEANGRVDEDVATRFAFTAFLLGLASLRLPDSRAWRPALLLAIVAFGAFKLTDAARLHAQQRLVYAEFRSEILSRIPEQSRVLPVLAEKGRGAPRTTYFFQFFANYVVPERHGYCPTVYAKLGQQFLRHRPPGGNGRGEHRDVYETKISDEEWAFYDFVVVQTNEEVPPVAGLSERTEPLAVAAGFRLYRVLR